MHLWRAHRRHGPPTEANAGPGGRLRKGVRQESRGLGTRALSQFTSLTASGRSRSPRTLPADLAEEGSRIRTDARRL